MTSKKENQNEDSKKLRQEIEQEIDALASLDNLGYELAREEKAIKLGLRVSVLDDLVEQRQKKHNEGKAETVLFEKLDPWPHKIILCNLLDELEIIIKRFVLFNSEHESKAISLWVVHTFCLDAFYISPLLFVTSPEMRSGKSTLLAILQRLTFKCVAASSISPSVLYRLISKHHPTIICDEADSYMIEKNEDLRGILNAGHSRDTAGVLRTNPDSLEVERFDAFGAKCLAAIKGLPSTVEDRAVIIKMRRKPKGNKTEKLRLISENIRNEFHNIQRKCLRFSNDSIVDIKNINPSVPVALNDRAADNWYALFQIAELAGKDWLKYATEAALFLSGIEQDSKSLGIELLEDIKNLFDGRFKNETSVPTLKLIEALAEDDEAPWATYNSKRQDQKITPRQFANLLSPYGIKSINNIGSGNQKGYSKPSFQDAFNRYLYTSGSDFEEKSASVARPYNHAGFEDVDSSDSTRSDPLSALKIVSESRKERQRADNEKTLNPTPHMVGAAGADKNEILEGRMHIDV